MNVFWARSARTLNQLLERLSSYDFRYYPMNDWILYTSVLLVDRYVAGKQLTQ
ncbi:hypothetical protein [Kistimonas scapharcae]|uniref:hypothetical protein n=1 Tax=Kistimonas scapharcae TaxID=1036133 RepID=UPI003CD07A5E